jgi:hypothetical protein
MGRVPGWNVFSGQTETNLKRRPPPRRPETRLEEAPRGGYPRGDWSLVPIAIAVAEPATAAARPTAARTAGTTGTAALVRFADAELAAAKVLTIERIARRVGGVCFHLDEAEAA